MTDREFKHRLYWNNCASTWSGDLTLSTTDIAEAAILEIIQLSLSASPFDLLLEQLLTPGASAFEWVAQLGHVRETKTALSGLFGRFVARAYLTQVWGYEYFEPLHLDITPLSAATDSAAIRVATGDLPDWLIATSPSSRLIAIAEGKGSHDTGGPSKILKAAKEQAKRVGIFRGTCRIRTNRFAVVTRWAVSGNPKLEQPWLVVDDPDEGEVTPSAEELAYLRRGVALGHYASLCRGLGLPQTALALERARGLAAGSLTLPEEEMVTVEQGGGRQRMAAGILAGSGIIPIARSVSDRYFQAVEEVFEGRAMLVGVSADAILAADGFPLAQKLDTPASEEEHFLPSLYEPGRPASEEEPFLPSLFAETQEGEPPEGSEVRHGERRPEDLERPAEPVPDGPAFAEPSREEPVTAFWRRRRRTAGGFEFRPLEDLGIDRGSADETQADPT